MIKLERIFEEQDKLNKETAAKHEEYSKLTRDGLTRNYVLSCLGECGELLNEWNHHKIWKATRKENRDAPCKKCEGIGFVGITSEQCPYCEEGRKNPFREEYIDVVHFAVSVAIGFNLSPKEYVKGLIAEPRKETTSDDSYNLYLDLYKQLVYANVLIEELDTPILTEKLVKNNRKERIQVATDLLNVLFDLGYSFGFTDEDIEHAYFAKHKINQIRQVNNY